MRVGLVVHAGRERSVRVAQQAATLLRDHDVEVVVAAGADPADGPALDGEVAHLDPAEFAATLDACVSFGGDGTFLRAAHLCRDAGVGVLGVNLGRLGFLAEVEQDQLHPALDALVAGDIHVEDRPTLRVEVVPRRGADPVTGWALNEVSIEKTVRQRLLLMDVRLDDSLFARIPADALILATPTGSTAYALSAGGPIVSPKIEATLVVPVAPHTLFDRTIVAAPEQRVEVELVDEQAPGVVSCDGRTPVNIEPGGRVRVVGGGRAVRVLRVDPLDMATVVRRKFQLP